MNGANVLRMDLAQRNGRAAFIQSGRLKGWTPGQVNALRSFLRLPSQARANGLGDSGVIVPTLTTSLPTAPASINIDTSTFTMPSPTDVFMPSFVPTSGGGNYIPSQSVLYPLTVAPPGSSPSQSAQTVAALIAGAAAAASPLIQGNPAQPAQSPSSSGVSSWLAQPSGLGVSNQVVLAGGLGLIAIVLLARRK